MGMKCCVLLNNKRSPTPHFQWLPVVTGLQKCKIKKWYEQPQIAICFSISVKQVGMCVNQENPFCFFKLSLRQSQAKQPDLFIFLILDEVISHPSILRKHGRVNSQKKNTSLLQKLVCTAGLLTHFAAPNPTRSCLILFFSKADKHIFVSLTILSIQEGTQRRQKMLSKLMQLIANMFNI